MVVVSGVRKILGVSIRGPYDGFPLAVAYTIFHLDGPAMRRSGLVSIF